MSVYVCVRGVYTNNTAAPPHKIVSPVFGQGTFQAPRNMVIVVDLCQFVVFLLKRFLLLECVLHLKLEIRLLRLVWSEQISA